MKYDYLKGNVNSTIMKRNETELILNTIDLSVEPPEEEPARQYYFLKEGRELVLQMSRRKGHSLTAHSECFGCQMNARDSEKLTGMLECLGYSMTDREDADFVIYNTCTVRENANTRVYGRLGYLHNRKDHNPDMMIALCGCMMQEPKVVETLEHSFSFVNLIFGTHNLYRFPELFVKAWKADGMVIDIEKDSSRIVENLPNERKFPFKSGINITYGCNNFCSYCIVPYVRGRERSRAPEDIIHEIATMTADGVTEVMLLGQNVNSYGKTLDTPVTFAELLRRVSEIDGIHRIRFMTSHPKDLSAELIDAMNSSERICNHLHLPLQSGSSTILKSMNRHYTKEQYLSLVDMIRRKIPDISLTTDVIVGFPGETEEDFEETLDVVRRVRFDSAYTFLYSRREGTPAASMTNQIPEETAKERFSRLLAEVQEIGQNVTGRHAGTVQEILVESVNRQDSSLVTARMRNNTVVHFPGGSDLIGRYVPVLLEESKGFYYIGRKCQ